MEMPFQYCRMKLPAIGAMLGIPHCAISIGRKRFPIRMESDTPIGLSLRKRMPAISKG